MTDRKLQPAGVPHTPILVPFWGTGEEGSPLPNATRYDRLARNGRTYLGLVDNLDAADAAVLPADWCQYQNDPQLMRAAMDFIAKVAAAGKKTLVFHWSDDEEPLSIPGTVVYRTGGYRSRFMSHERSMPSWSEDFMAWHCDGHLPLRPKGGAPIVSFCGNAGSSKRQARRWPARVLGRRLQKANPGDYGRQIRAQAMERLSAHRGIETRFEVHGTFFGGALDAVGALVPEAAAAARRAYVENMKSGHYVLCTRGTGNFSYRLYEAMSLGRIPVFVDADSPLPFWDEIDWQSVCVWLDVEEIDSIGHRVMQFHKALDDDGFMRLQQRVRSLWEEWIAPESFFRKVSGRLDG